MARYQLPPLKNESQFEEFVCDILNEIEKTDSYSCFQSFGVKGQNQKGIDIISVKKGTVIQCKVKDVRGTPSAIRKRLKQDISQDLERSSQLNFRIDRFIFASTFRDDAVLQEFTASLKMKGIEFDVLYWGWDTLSKYAEDSKYILKKYFPKFKTKKPKAKALELPDGALGKDLLKKNYTNYLIKRYGDWKQYELNKKGEKFNWGSFKKSIIKRYRADGINHIHVGHFEVMVLYLQERIDKTIMGKVDRSKGINNYSTFEEHIKDIPPLPHDCIVWSPIF